MFQYFIFKMDCQSTNILEICKEFGIYTVNSMNEIDNNLKVSLN